mmetsp:Transcript_26257/g.66821  ORF Transcript_26257/g.66821 Transcript_26257/m.66821 type:complete len:208 (-) Transcript_26257:614-1237(-)
MGTTRAWKRSSRASTSRRAERKGRFPCGSRTSCMSGTPSSESNTNALSPKPPRTSPAPGKPSPEHVWARSTTPSWSSVWGTSGRPYLSWPCIRPCAWTSPNVPRHTATNSPGGFAPSPPLPPQETATEPWEGGACTCRTSPHRLPSRRRTLSVWPNGYNTSPAPDTWLPSLGRSPRPRSASWNWSWIPRTRFTTSPTRKVWPSSWDS